MSYVPYPKATFLVPTSDTQKHLFLVITKPCSANCHLLLSITSVRSGSHHDATCEFTGGEHEFIRHHSYVLYARAEQKNSVAISKMVHTGYYHAKDDFKDEHFLRVCNGIAKSQFVKPWVVKYFNQNR